MSQYIHSHARLVAPGARSISEAFSPFPQLRYFVLFRVLNLVAPQNDEDHSNFVHV